MLFSKASMAVCFIDCKYWSYVFEKYWHIYVTTKYPLKTGWMSIIACQTIKPTLKWLLTKEGLGCLFKCSSKSSSFDIGKAL